MNTIVFMQQYIKICPLKKKIKKKRKKEMRFVSVRYKMIRIVCFCLQWTDRHTHMQKKDIQRT